MRPLQVFSVTPRLPDNLRILWDLAYNLWFEWKHEISELFSQIDHRLWLKSHANPVWFLNQLSQGTIEELSTDPFFVERLQELKQGLDLYASRTSSPIPFAIDDPAQPVVAYFSAEYGLAHCLPIYSGGLGILAGDHLKSASDLNLPLVAVGLCYQNGYFRQYLTNDGWQQERYPTNDFEQLPLQPVLDSAGNPLTVAVDILDHPLSFRAWKASVGRVDLYLLDANIADNPPEYRRVTSQLYGGGPDMRLQQEILLGIGGIRLLRDLGLYPSVIHLNEGHSAFAGLERIRHYMLDRGLPFEAAKEIVASSSVFTTHTPVPAGNDRFAPDSVSRYFTRYIQDLKLGMSEFLGLGRENPGDQRELFCMTVLALKISRFNNGVSKVHGAVSRGMWHKVWAQYPVEDVPIGSITNGVHVPTWISRDFATLFERYLGSNWREDPDCQRLWRQAEAIPDSELWRTHERLRERLVDFARTRLRDQVLARGGKHWEAQLAEEALDPGILTVGFARRFVSYKRAGLLLRDEQRLLRLLSSRDQPLQFIFAGKAHPQDREGKKIIQQIFQLCQSPECRHRMVFLEDYDMDLAGYLLQGCDVWLNTPRPPLEACGTSGMKAVANGVLTLSTLDGWWAEAYQPDNSLGWAIGRGEVYEDHEYQDFVESQILYNLLENDIIPLFYERGKANLPREWIRRMKKGLVRLVPQFSSHRMVEDYCRLAYLHAQKNYKTLATDNYAAARDLAQWRIDISRRWEGLHIRNVTAMQPKDLHVDQTVEVEAEVFLNGLKAEEVRVEIYAGPLDPEGSFLTRTNSPMRLTKPLDGGWSLFRGETRPGQSGRFGFTVRVLPDYPLLLDPHSLGLVHWAGQDTPAP